MKRSPEVADIFRAFGEDYRQVHGREMPLRHFRIMDAIEACRTATLGGHVDVCDQCGHIRISYNSCRNRHCPKCQALAKEQWIEHRKADLLPVPYFHIVFTLPQQLRPLALRNQRQVYNLLFKAASETLTQLGGDPKHLGAQIGFIAILHTWSQTLLDHPHLHCIVTGGGLSADGEEWISSKEDFFIHVKVLSRLFRGKFLDYLRKAYEEDELRFPGHIALLKEDTTFKTLVDGLYKKAWHVYCKKPFATPQQVIEYLGRYTHRVAISNERILKLEGDQITFSYRDYTDGDKIKQMTLHAFEFIRRFLLHILPDRFVKIRHYGILSNRNKHTKLKQCRQRLKAPPHKDPHKGQKITWEDLLFRLTGTDPRICPHCGKGRMIQKETLLPKQPGAPPQTRKRSA